MKERGVSQRVARVLTVDLNKSALLDSLNYASGLIRGQDTSALASLIKAHKMKKYQEIISQLAPVIKQFETIKENHKDLVSNLQKLNAEVDSCIVKTAGAIKLGKEINTEMATIKSKKIVLNAVLKKVVINDESPDKKKEMLSESVLSVVNKLAQVSKVNNS